MAPEHYVVEEFGGFDGVFPAYFRREMSLPFVGPSWDIGVLLRGPSGIYRGVLRYLIVVRDDGLVRCVVRDGSGGYGFSEFSLLPGVVLPEVLSLASSSSIDISDLDSSSVFGFSAQNVDLEDIVKGFPGVSVCVAPKFWS